jgi:hypothetical protein
VPRPVAPRQSNWLRGESDAVCGPVFVSPPLVCLAWRVLLLIVPAMALASITLAGRLDPWKPVQQLPFGGSSRL